jgi:hypothetical protein
VTTRLVHIRTNLNHPKSNDEKLLKLYEYLSYPQNSKFKVGDKERG